MTDNSTNLRQFINTLETKQSNQKRPNIPKPEPIGDDSDKS